VCACQLQTGPPAAPPPATPRCTRLWGGAPDLCSAALRCHWGRDPDPTGRAETGDRSATACPEGGAAPADEMREPREPVRDHQKCAATWPDRRKRLFSGKKDARMAQRWPLASRPARDHNVRSPPGKSQDLRASGSARTMLDGGSRVARPSDFSPRVSSTSDPHARTFFASRTVGVHLVVRIVNYCYIVQGWGERSPR
jgi:hypothetical protein